MLIINAHIVLAKLSQQSITGNSRRCAHARCKTILLLLTTDSAGGRMRNTVQIHRLHCILFRKNHLMLPGLLHGWPHDDQGVVRKHNINAADTARLM